MSDRMSTLEHFRRSQTSKTYIIYQFSPFRGPLLFCFRLFYFGHCVVSPSIYASDYIFGIFKRFFRTCHFELVFLFLFISVLLQHGFLNIITFFFVKEDGWGYGV